MKKPTVTALCDLLNKPQLITWANNIGLNGESMKGFQRKVFDLGNKKHNEIEDFLLNGVCLDDLEKQKKIEDLFLDCQIISIEEPFENDNYKGRVDIRFIKNGISYIGDFKSKFKKPYMEHYIQLIAYKMHFGCDKICIIDLRDFILHEISLEKENTYKELINNLVNIFNLKQQL